MINPLDRLRGAKDKSDANNTDGRNYQAFTASMRAQGWNDADVAEYACHIKILMGNDDAAAIELFPAGLYANADTARQGARDYWKGYAA